MWSCPQCWPVHGQKPLTSPDLQSKLSFQPRSPCPHTRIGRPKRKWDSMIKNFCRLRNMTSGEIAAIDVKLWCCCFFFSAPVCLQGLGVGLLYMAVSRQRGECCIGRQRSNSCTVQFPRYGTEGGWPNPSHALSYGAGVWLGTVGSRGMGEKFHTWWYEAIDVFVGGCVFTSGDDQKVRTIWRCGQQ